MRTFQKATGPNSSPDGIRRLHSVQAPVCRQEKWEWVIAWAAGEACLEQKGRLFFLSYSCVAEVLGGENLAGGAMPDE